MTVALAAGSMAQPHGPPPTSLPYRAWSQDGMLVPCPIRRSSPQRRTIADEAATLHWGNHRLGRGTTPAAWAQQSPLIGVLDATSAVAIKVNHDAFRDGLRQLGYVEGRNIQLEYRFADGVLDRLPGLAEELVRLNPKVIVSAPLPANLAVKRATSTIPIVMATGADPVGFGLVQSLSRPGGNLTGITNFAEELAPKQLDLIRELLPGATRVASSSTSPTSFTCLNGKKRGPPLPRRRLPSSVLTIARPKISSELLPVSPSRKSKRFSSRPMRLSMRAGRVSSNWRQRRACRPSTSTGFLRSLVACCPMDPISRRITAGRRLSLTRF